MPWPSWLDVMRVSLISCQVSNASYMYTYIYIYVFTGIILYIIYIPAVALSAYSTMGTETDIPIPFYTCSFHFSCHLRHLAMFSLFGLCLPVLNNMIKSLDLLICTFPAGIYKIISLLFRVFIHFSSFIQIFHKRVHPKKTCLHPHQIQN